MYTYDDLPPQLRVQIVHIWMDTLGTQNEASICEGPKKAYPDIVNTLCKEYGQYFLAAPQDPFAIRDYFLEMVTFFEREQNVERALDVIELSFQAIDIETRQPRYLSRQNANKIADDAIATLNGCFREHGIGYRYSDGHIIRIDSEFLHSEAVIPALRLLNQTHYAGAQEEFLRAHTHYRGGHGKEALNECLKAFESVMKTICDRRRWTLPFRPTANALIQVCFDNTCQGYQIATLRRHSFSGEQGLGHYARLWFGIEIDIIATPARDSAASSSPYPVHMTIHSVGGNVTVKTRRRPAVNLGHINIDRPLWINTAPVSRKQQISMFVDLAPGQIEALEESRNGEGGLDFALSIAALTEYNGTTDQAYESLLFSVNQSHWLNVLTQIGYSDFLLFEIPAPMSATADADYIGHLRSRTPAHIARAV